MSPRIFFLNALFCSVLVLHRLSAQNLGCQAAKNYKALASIYYNAENLRSDTFDLLKTTINLEIGNSFNQQIKGNAQIRFAPKINGRNFIRFDLLKLVVDSVKENNSLRTYQYNDTILKVNFASAKNITDTSVFTIYYHGHPQTDATGWGGFYFDNTQGAEYAYNLGVGFDAKPHNYGRVWFPCFDNFVERCPYEFNISSDPGRISFCNGQLLSDVTQAGKRTRNWVLNEEIPSYLVCVALADYTQVNWTVNTLSGPKPITLAGVASDTAAMKAGFVNLKNCITGFETYFGPYKWNRFGYSLVPFGSGAMEHATNIAYPRAYIGNLSAEELMAHELSHHWWGDLTTCETPEDMWLNEGFATFSAYLFQEWQYGKNKYLDAVKTEHDKLLHFLHKDEGGFRAVSGVPHTLTYGDHVYKKGADVAHTLRGYMGDSAFFKGVKHVMQQNAYKHMNSADFRTLLQASSGLNLTDFFSNWVMAGGWSHFAVDSISYSPASPSGVNVRVAIRQKLYGALALHNNVPLELSFFKSDWSRELRQVMMSGAAASFTLSLPFAPVYCALNYDSKIGDASSHESKTIKNTGNTNYNLAKASVITSNKGADSSLIRVVHNYVKPDAFKNNPGQHRLSEQRYWRVEGILASGYAGKIKFSYDGSKTGTGANSFLDTCLTPVNGDSIALFYRKDAREDWRWLRNATKVINNAKTGSLTSDSLRLGDYAFANLADTTYLQLAKNTRKRLGVNVYPNPARHLMQVEFSEKPGGPATYEILDLQGRRVLSGELRGKKNELNVQLLPAGTYLLELRENGEQLHSQKILLN